VVVRSLQAALAGNTNIRSEDVFFNLMATPGYPELIDDMVAVNVDKKEIAFIVGDTPARLQPTGTAITDWATNTANVGVNGEDALLTRNTYVGVYYPWGLSTD